MRKIYTPITILTAAVMIGLTGCHSDKKPASNVITNTVTGGEVHGVNESNERTCGSISMIFDESMKEALAAYETMRSLYNEISRKYPIPSRGFNVFDNSHAKQQALLMNSLIGVFNDGVPISKYGTFTKDSFINIFQTKMWLWKDANKCESLKYDPSVKGHDIASIRARITVLDGIVSDFIHSLDAVLKFDYLQFDRQYHPLISQFWSQIYVANRKAYDLQKYVNSIKHDLWHIDFKEGY